MWNLIFNFWVIFHIFYLMQVITETITVLMCLLLDYIWSFCVIFSKVLSNCRQGPFGLTFDDTLLDWHLTGPFWNDIWLGPFGLTFNWALLDWHLTRPFWTYTWQGPFGLTFSWALLDLHLTGFFCASIQLSHFGLTYDWVLLDWHSIGSF